MKLVTYRSAAESVSAVWRDNQIDFSLTVALSKAFHQIGQR